MVPARRTGYRQSNDGCKMLSSFLHRIILNSNETPDYMALSVHVDNIHITQMIMHYGSTCK
jgi:hypothetical protein